MLRVPTPRLLPLTIVAMAALLGAKAIDVARAAAAGGPPQAVAAAVVPPAQAQPAPAPPIRSAVPRGAAVVPTTGASAPATPAAISVPGIPPPAPASPAEQALLGDLRARRRALDARARALDARDAVLSAAERTLDMRVRQLATLQASLEALEARRKKREDANWVGLVKVYETMPPRRAATIFDSLDMNVLLPILDRMAERKAAPILAAMQPDRARAATDALARLRTRETQLGKS